MKREIISEKVKRALLQLGLTEKEILAYLTLLEHGALSIQDISRQTGVNRVTIYVAVEMLGQKGLIVQSKRGKRTVFIAESPDNLMELIKLKKTRLKKEEMMLNNILPLLNTVSADPKQKPQIKFYEGRRGMCKVFDDIIINSTKYLIGCGSYDTAVKATSLKAEAAYFKAIKRSNIFYKVVLEDTPLNRQFAEIGKGAMHVKFLPKGISVSADVHVFNSSVALMSYETMVTTLVEEMSIAQSIRLYLEFMWDSL